MDLGVEVQGVELFDRFLQLLCYKVVQKIVTRDKRRAIKNTSSQVNSLYLDFLDQIEAGLIGVCVVYKGRLRWSELRIKL